MNKYESIIIVNPNTDEAGLKALEEKFTGLINGNGKVENVTEMGKRKYRSIRRRPGKYHRIRPVRGMYERTDTRQFSAD